MYMYTRVAVFCGVGWLRGEVFGVGGYQIGVQNTFDEGVGGYLIPTEENRKPGKT